MVAASVTTGAAEIEELGLEGSEHGDIGGAGIEGDGAAGSEVCRHETCIGGDALMKGVEDAEFDGGDVGRYAAEGDVEGSVVVGSQKSDDAGIVAGIGKAGKGEVVATWPSIGAADGGGEADGASVGDVGVSLVDTAVVTGGEEEDGY